VDDYWERRIDHATFTERARALHAAAEADGSAVEEALRAQLLAGGADVASARVGPPTRSAASTTPRSAATWTITGSAASTTRRSPSAPARYTRRPRPMGLLSRRPPTPPSGTLLAPSALRLPWPGPKTALSIPCPRRFARLKSLLLAAGVVQPHERADFLDRACADDLDLRREAERILATEDDPDGILRTGYGQPQADTVAWSSSDRDASRSMDTEMPEQMIGPQVGHFRIVKQLGKGGMGEVFKAEDMKLGRSVALKFLSSELDGSSEAGLRFQREARATAALNHPHICTIFEIGEHEGRPYFAMEYLEGTTLKDAIASCPLPIDRLQSLAFQLCDALQEAHSKGILHRDIKPANVILDRKGTAKLLDFGLAKSMAAPSEGLDVIAAASGESAADLAMTLEAKLTRTGSTPGTLFYMSPEQLRGEELDARSDLYSLGRLLYEAATGSMGFEGRAAGEVFEAILGRTPALASTLRPDVPPALDVVIDRCLQTDRGNRFDSASEVREAMIVVGRDRSAAGSFISSFEGLRTLGRLRSGAWVIVLIPASLLLSLYVAIQEEPGDHWLSASPLLILALFGFALTWLIYRRSFAPAKPSTTSRPPKLRRLEEPDSDRGWMWGYLLPGIGAVCMTVAVVVSVWNMIQGGGPSALDLMSRVLWAVLFWIPVVLARRWRKTLPARRSREIELEASYPQILSRVSDAIEDLEARVIGLDLEDGWVLLTTSAAVWAGMGERVTIRIHESSPGVQSVALESVSIAPWFGFDTGKNNENLNKIVKIMLH
jgi:serine/threonine protein kinase